MIGTRVTLWLALVTERFREVNGSNLFFAFDKEISSEELVGLGLLSFAPVTMCGAKCGMPCILSYLTSVMMPARSSLLLSFFFARFSIYS